MPNDFFAYMKNWRDMFQTMPMTLSNRKDVLDKDCRKKGEKVFRNKAQLYC